MNKTTWPQSDGYAVEVSLLKLKPRSLVLAAACSATLFVLLGWLGGGAGDLAASKTGANQSANVGLRAERATIPNNATSQPAPPAPVEDRKEASAPSEASSETPSGGEAVPGPSPAGFAETAAPEAVQNAAEVAQNAAAANAPAPQTIAPTAPAVAPSGGGFTVQAGSFNTVSEANERVSALRAAGFEARTAAVEIAGRGTWHRVYTGRFATREEAAAHDKKLRSSGAVAATLVTPVQD